MAGKGRANFDVLARLIEVDPVRMARFGWPGWSRLKPSLPVNTSRIRDTRSVSHLAVPRPGRTAALRISQTAVSNAPSARQATHRQNLRSEPVTVWVA